MANEAIMNREISAPSYIGDGDPGMFGGGTYTHPKNDHTQPSIQDYENIFGPAARSVQKIYKPIDATSHQNRLTDILEQGC
jgi:hypothetical protein